MEALYAKLYSKYDALKKKRISELDEINKDQEVNFLNYVSAAEELIQHLRNENENLAQQVSELRTQLASLRSAKDDECMKYQKLLMEENEKNQMLYGEVERLQKLQEQPSINSKDGKYHKEQLKMLQSSQDTPAKVISESARVMTRKRSREERAVKEGLISPHRRIQYDLSVRESAKSSSTLRKRSKTDRGGSESFINPEQSNQDNLLAGKSVDVSSKVNPASGGLEYEQQLGCCGRTVLGGAVIDNGSTNCKYQALIECLFNLKLSTVNQSEGICISALHQSSGYSFSLTWIKNATGDESELLYRVLTLGTFEMVAPEWMRSALVFSMSMCPIFFERVSRFIKTLC